jgi:ubiquinone/menaquinone biosynthesis C-methylase UbiE
MAELHRQDPLGRFTDLADDYDRYRPDYPAEAIACILQTAALGPHSLVADVGCGTGISSRLIAAQGIPVIGIEPNEAMRQRAEAASPASGALLTYRSGRAEATGLANASVNAVLSAQAFHWFEPAAALAEFQRILVLGGWVFLTWNERDETDACTSDYGAVIRTASDARDMEQGRHRAGEVLGQSPLFENAELSTFIHRQTLDCDGLIGRAFSISYAPRDPSGVMAWRTALNEVFERHRQQGHVTLHYRTSLYLARAVQKTNSSSTDGP